jgi:hypothetical protein
MCAEQADTFNLSTCGVSLACGLFVKFSASLELVGWSYMRLTSLSDPSENSFHVCAP